MLTHRSSDKNLYTRLKRKDKEAFTQVYDTYVEHIYRFIFFKVNRAETAEDLTSQTFLKAWDLISREELKNYDTLKALIYKIARNLVIDHYRLANRDREISLEAIESRVDQQDDKQDLVRQIEVADEFAQLTEKMRELKDEYREAIVLRYINELSIVEIAEILNKTKGNTRVLLYRATKALKEISQSE